MEVTLTGSRGELGELLRRLMAEVASGGYGEATLPSVDGGDEVTLMLADMRHRGHAKRPPEWPEGVHARVRV